jgi:Flp pilus assembly protein TadG
MDFLKMLRPRRSIGGRRRDAQSGGAAVEFALVLPLFMTLVMGAVDYGYFFFSEQVITNAAREGARAGTLINFGTGAAPLSGMPAAAVSAARAAAAQYMTNNGVSCSGGTSCVAARVCPSGATSGTFSSSCPGATGYGVEVLIKYSAVSLTGFTKIVLPSNVFADSYMRWQ